MRSISFILVLMIGIPRFGRSVAITNTPADSLKNILEVQLDTTAFKSEAHVVAYLSHCYALIKSSPAEALFYATALESKLKQEGDTSGRAHILKYKGNFYWYQGAYATALENYFKALRLFEQENNTTEIAKILNNIGETYKKQKDYKKGAHFLKRALSKAEKIQGQKPELVLVNLGQLYMLQEKNDSALFYFEKIINDTDISNVNATGFALLYKGMVKREQGQYDSASFFLLKSMQIWKSTSFKRSIAETRAELALLAIEQNQLQSAEKLLKQAKAEAIESSAADILMRIYKYQIELARQVGTKAQLASYYENYIDLKDSIYDEETRSEINKLSIEYELSQKEKDYYKLALEQNVLSNEVQSQNRFLFFLIVVILAAALFILVLWRQRNNLRKMHSQLRVQKEEIENKQNEIFKKSLELASLNKELYALNRTLEEKIVERSEQLHKKNRQIAEFTYFNSHKLRAPVASVLGLINVMELSEHSTLDKSLLDHLKTSALELDAIIHQLKNILESEISEFES